jgi:hypothetical protein
MPRPVDLLCPPDWGFEATASGTKVTRRSVFDRQMYTMELPVSQERIEIWASGAGALIQDAFPELNADQREFLMSGATPEKWEEMFG